MIDLILEKLKAANSRETKLHILREFLQVLILKIMASKGAFKNVVFLGGTALRIVHRLRRYSEDLDFSLIDKQGYEFNQLLVEIQRELELVNIASEIKAKAKAGIVNSSFIHFTNILQATKLAVAKDQKFSIKLEIDTNPPQGGNLETVLINQDFIFSLVCYDLPSLMAGKCHAVLQRTYVKGRDYYDLLWYLTKRIEPNLVLLNKALAQSFATPITVTKENWRTILLARLESLNFIKIRKDVENFLEDPQEVELLKLESFQGVLQA